MAERQIRIVLADDHPAVRAGIRQFIERDPGLVVLAEADDGAQALDLIQRLQPDVAVVDFRMPRLPGLEVVGQVRKHWPAVRLIILTAG